MFRLPVPAWAGVACLFLITILLSACGPGSGPPECVELQVPFTVPFYAPADLDEISIEPGESEKPLYLKWGYPTGDCMPDRFRVVVNDVPVMEGESLYDGIFFSPGAMVVGADSRDFPYYSTYMVYAVTTPMPFPPGVYWFWVIPQSGEWFHGERGGPFHTSLWPGDCDPAEPYVAKSPELIYPANGQMVDTLSPTLIWRNRNLQENGCFEYTTIIPLYSQITDDLRIVGEDMEPSTGVEFVTRDYIPEGVRSISLNLTECERTYWKVIAIAPTRGEGYAFDIVLPSETFYFDVNPDLCTFAEIPPEVHWPTSSPSPIALIREPSNCRSGPTTEYPVLDILVEGAQLPIQGRNRAGDSWLVEDANISHTCWVHGSMVEVIGDTSLVMIADPDPPPTAVPTDTPQFNCAQFNSNTCTVNNHPCVWNGNICVNK